MIVFAINANGRSKDHIIRDKNREANNIRSEWTSCLDSTGRVLCRVDKNFLHSYDTYDSTIIPRGLLLTSQATKCLSPLSEMYFSTPQLTLRVGWTITFSTRTTCTTRIPLTGSLANITSNKISKSPLNEMHLSWFPCHESSLILSRGND